MGHLVDDNWYCRLARNIRMVIPIPCVNQENTE